MYVNNSCKLGKTVRKMRCRKIETKSVSLFRQKLCRKNEMSEKWDHPCDTTVSTQTRSPSPPPTPVNLAKIPYTKFQEYMLIYSVIWHHSATPHSEKSSPPPSLSSFQKLLTTEQTDIHISLGEGGGYVFNK